MVAAANCNLERNNTSIRPASFPVLVIYCPIKQANLTV